MLKRPTNPNTGNSIHTDGRFPFLLLPALVLPTGFCPAGAQVSPAAIEPPAPPLIAVEQSAEGDDGPADGQEEFKVCQYGSPGLDIRSRDGNDHAHTDWRAQFRFTSRDFSRLGDKTAEVGKRREEPIRLQWDFSY
jgi:hypothetical protein